MKATRSRHSWVHMFITHCPTVTLHLHNFDLFRTCRTSSFCTVALQLARFQLTQRIARSPSDSWASCWEKVTPLFVYYNRLTARTAQPRWTHIYNEPGLLQLTHHYRAWSTNRLSSLHSSNAVQPLLVFIYTEHSSHTHLLWCFHISVI